MSKLNANTKYAILGNYKSLAIPVSLLNQIIEQGFLVSMAYDYETSVDAIDSIECITKCTFLDGTAIVHAIAEAKLSGDKV